MKISNWAIMGSGSVITKDVPPYAIDCRGQFFFGSPDGIVLELLEQANYFITTRESTSSKGIDYIETFGGHVLSGMEYDIYADVEP